LFVWWCMSGGQNDQTPGNAGPEANLDIQFGLGMSFPTPGTFYSTGGSPPFQPDARTQSNSNEPYDDVRGIPIHSADVLILFRSICLLSGYNLCWHCAMGMYRRPFRRATAMTSKPVRTNPPFLSLYITIWAQVSSSRTSCPGTDLRLVSSAQGLCNSCLQRIWLAW
jgi:hypothetical protein